MLGAALMLLAAVAHGKATVVIVNADSPDAGFNDPTPCRPSEATAGTTLGAQRLVVFQKAAESGQCSRERSPDHGPFALPAIELYQHRRNARERWTHQRLRKRRSHASERRSRVNLSEAAYLVRLGPERSLRRKTARLRHRDGSKQLRHPGALQLGSRQPECGELRRAPLVLRAR